MSKLARVLVWSALCALLVTGLPAHSASRSEQPFKIIVNSSNPAMTVSTEEASSLFLKKTSAWPNGVWVEPVDLHRSSDVREGFTRAVHRKSVAAVRSYWQRAVFSGLATPAPTLKTDAEVVEFVARRAGAIGYVSEGASLQVGVRVVELVN